MLIAVDRAVVNRQLITDAWVAWEHGAITEMGSGAPPRRPDLTLPGTLAPGYVDIHCHGARGSAFDDDAPDVDAIVGFHAAKGTTRQALSLVTAPMAQLVRRVRVAAEYCVHDPRLLGIHLEGPFLADSHRGAHSASALRNPTDDAVDQLLEAGRGQILQVTIAPERPGGLSAIKRFVAHGVRVAIGHTAADAATARAAFDAGATILTHACNGMPPMHHRAPGPLAAALLDPRVMLEVIADGAHVAAEMLALLAQSAPERLVLISDAMAAAGMPDGAYRIGSLDVRVERGVPRLADGTSIAGSTLTLDRAVRVLAEAGAPLLSAIGAATQVPADAIGRRDLGRLAVGAAADLVVLDEDMAVRHVWRAGVSIRTEM